MILVIKISEKEFLNYREIFMTSLDLNISNESVEVIIIFTDSVNLNINRKKVIIIKRDGNKSYLMDMANKIYPNRNITWLNKFDVFKGKVENTDIITKERLSNKRDRRIIGDRIKEDNIIIKERLISKKDRRTVGQKIVSVIEVKPDPKIDVIIVSVNYNDLLLVSLTNNIKYFKNITVVTSSDDLMCQKICDKFGVKYIVTDRMYEDGSSFNKGKAINEGIRSVDNPDWILLLDADIVLNNRLELSNINEDTLYTSDRYICESYDNYVRYKEGHIEIDKIGKYDSEKGLGFFQLFNINNKNIDKDKPFPESSSNAAWSDLQFRDKFSKRRKVEISTIHLGSDRKNWNGRETERFLTDDDFYNLYSKKSKFTICSYYFNFRGDVRQKNNFIKFLEQFKNHYSNMIVGLVDYGDIDFEIPCESIIIKGDNDNKIWSKEILINKIIDKVDTDYLLWIDGDLIYNNLDWLNNIDKVVNGNDFVQLFEDINYLGSNGELLESHKSIISSGGKNIDNLSGYKPGGSWLGKVSILKDKKLFEKMYVGGGDTIFMYGLSGVNSGITLNKIKESNEDIYNESIEWINNFGKYKVGYLNETVNHLYHGDLKDRNYNSRYKRLSKVIEPIIEIEDDSVDVTILILAHKESEYLDKCINSAKNQKFDGKFEILLSSDSNKYLESISNQYGIRFTLAEKPYKNTSCSFNFNHGVVKSRGKYIKILAYDDWLPEGSIQNLHDFIKDDKFTLIYANSYENYNNGKIEKYIPTVKENLTIEDQYQRNQIHGGTIMFNREEFIEADGLDERLIYAEEYDFYFKLLNLGKKIGYLDKFVYHYRRHSEQKGTLSLSNEQKEEKKKIVDSIKNQYNGKQIICGLATIRGRESSLKETVKSIIDQVDRLIVYQNGYKEIFDFLNDEKIEVISSLDTGVDMGDAGKFYRVQDFKNCYYFSIDDDLLYPIDYVKNTINELESINNQSVVSYHGKKYDESAKSYYNDIEKNYKCLDVVNENSIIDFPGTGVMCFHTKYLNLKFTDFEYPNMADVFLGIELRNKNKKCLVLKHQKGWIKHNNINLSETLFVRNRNNIRIDEVFNRRILPRFCIVTTMWKRHSLTDFVFSYYNKLRDELKNDINLILIACGSEFDISKEIAEKNNFIYIESTNFPLSQKHNKLFIKSKEFDPDGVVLVGSDDFISKNILLTYKKIMKSYDYIGIKDFYLINEVSEIRFWPGYENDRSNEPVGGGRFYKKTLLDKVDWTPWKNLEINKSLDYAFSKIIEDIEIESKVIECSDKNGILFTIRTDVNITKMKNIGYIYNGDIISKELFNIQEILNFQKNILNNEK